MRLSAILSVACLLVATAPLVEAQDRELGWGGFGFIRGQGGYGGGGYWERDSFPEEDLVSISCSAEFECSCNGGDATFVCREKTCNDGTTKFKAKCINPDRARPTDVCGCCGEECPRRNKHNTFDKWDEDFFSEDSEDSEDEDETEIFESFPDPTANPTRKPSPEPTAAPVASPTVAPVVSPTMAPVVSPTVAPVPDPTSDPTDAPSPLPSETPVASPSAAPSATPVTQLDPTTAPVTTTVLLTQDDTDEPLPENTVTITEYLGTAVTFTVTQLWKTSGSISWIAPAYDQAAGDMYCEENDKRTSVAYNEVHTYTAQCDGDTATVDLFVHDGTFSGSQSNIRGCNGWGNDNSIAYYSLTLSCDGQGVQATTATAEFPWEEPEEPTASPTDKVAAIGNTSTDVTNQAGIDEEIKMRRIYLGAGAGAALLLVIAVIAKLCCCRQKKPRRKSVHRRDSETTFTSTST